MVNIANLEAWAITRGYDPLENYTEIPDGYLSQHFRKEEFECNHCGALHPNGVPPELLALLEDVREHFNAPVIINSGYRCPTHNANVGGASQSQHLLGTAADFWIRDVDPADVYAYLNPNHEGGLGKYITFTHADVRGSRARWSG